MLERSFCKMELASCWMSRQGEHVVESFFNSFSVNSVVCKLFSQDMQNLMWSLREEFGVTPLLHNDKCSSSFCGVVSVWGGAGEKFFVLHFSSTMVVSRIGLVSAEKMLTCFSKVFWLSPLARTLRTLSMTLWITSSS